MVSKIHPKTHLGVYFTPTLIYCPNVQVRTETLRKATTAELWKVVVGVV